MKSLLWGATESNSFAVGRCAPPVLRTEKLSVVVDVSEGHAAGGSTAKEFHSVAFAHGGEGIPFRRSRVAPFNEESSSISLAGRSPINGFGTARNIFRADFRKWLARRSYTVSSPLRRQSPFLYSGRGVTHDYADIHDECLAIAM